MPKYCDRCGAELKNEKSKFCDKCGNEINSSTNENLNKTIFSCSHCGFEITNFSGNCPNCGKPLKNKDGVKALGFGLGIIALIILVPTLIVILYVLAAMFI